MNRLSKTKQKLLQAEINWINNRPERYESPWHQKAVIVNIVKRYLMDEIKSRVSLWSKNKFVKHEFPIMEFFNINPNDSIWNKRKRNE